MTKHHDHYHPTLRQLLDNFTPEQELLCERDQRATRKRKFDESLRSSLGDLFAALMNEENNFQCFWDEINEAYMAQFVFGHHTFTIRYQENKPWKPWQVSVDIPRLVPPRECRNHDKALRTLLLTWMKELDCKQ